MQSATLYGFDLGTVDSTVDWLHLPSQSADWLHSLDTGDSIGEFAQLQPIIDQLPKTLSHSELAQVMQLLQNNCDIFSRHKFDLGCTDLVEVRIPTGDALPYAEGLRSQPRAHLQAIDNEIQQLLQADVIEPANLSWKSNIVCVKKKNGDLRICCDMRRLNLAHQPYIDKYPLSRIKDCIQTLAGKKLFSSLDASSSFHQVPIQPDDRHKTAFSTRRGQW